MVEYTDLDALLDAIRGQGAAPRRAGIRRATLSRIENGQTTGVDFEVLERLADVLEVDAGYLILHEHRPVRPRNRSA